jgi:hypothetical protein
MYGAQDPGNWQSFTNRADVKGLPLNEQKDQFLKEQINFQNMMEAIRAQAHVGGIRNNPIVNVAFNGDLDVISGFTSSLLVNYTFPVTVIQAGIPTIKVPNGLQGNGNESTITYGYVSSPSPTSLLFTYSQLANANGQGDIGANELAVNTELFGAITTSPSTPVEDTYTSVVGTYNSGAGGTGGQDIDATIEVSALQTVTSIIVTGNSSGVFQPGNTLTFAGSDLGGTGSLIVTLRAADITGDTLAFTATTDVNIEGGSIVNASDGRPPYAIFRSNVTKTALAE